MVSGVHPAMADIRHHIAVAHHAIGVRYLLSTRASGEQLAVWCPTPVHIATSSRGDELEAGQLLPTRCAHSRREEKSSSTRVQQEY